MRTQTRSTYIAVAIALLAHTALAGPPMICHPLEIGSEKSLPWGTGIDWDLKIVSYDTRRLTQQTLELLTPNTPVIVRMETLRRAVIYSGQKPELMLDLASRLIERSNKSHAEPLAAFDVGYFIETAHQYSKNDPLKGMDGYSLARKSVATATDPAAVEFGLSLMRASVSWPNDHYRNAVLGAKEGSLLATNLVRNAGAQSLSGLRNTVLAKR
jgi:hypothetical protein